MEDGGEFSIKNGEKTASGEDRHHGDILSWNVDETLKNTSNDTKIGILL